MMSWIDSRHWQISTGRHFQNGHHNTTQFALSHFKSFHMWVDYDVPNWFPTLNNFYWSPFSKWPPQYAKIQHCPISSKFDMWVDNDVPNWFPTLKNFYRSPFSKWPPQYHAKIQHCPISTPFHMWVDYDVPNWFLTLKNFYRSLFSKWPPQYRKKSTLSDIITIWYVGR